MTGKSRIFAAVFLSLILLGSVGLLLAPNSSYALAVGSLPGGTQIEVSIDSPVSSTTFQLGDDVDVLGTASVATGTIVKDTTVVYIMDVSGSMGADAGVDCDGNAGNDDRLTCEKEAVGAANAVAAAATSAVDETGLGSFSSSSTAHDVDLGTGGTQLIVSPDHDGDSNTTPDVVDVANSLSAGGGTCYACGVSAAETILASSTNPVNLVVFMSDGLNNSGASISSLTPSFPSGTVIRTFGIGPDVDCSSEEVAGIGSLDDVAALTSGGTCEVVSDISDLAEVITEAIGSNLVSLEISVGGGAPSLIDNSGIDPDLPQPGPASVSYQTIVSGLTAGDHTICVTATGTDVGGTGNVTDCVTIHINSPPDCSTAAASVSTLWPPNHKMKSVTVTGVTDPDGDPVSITITSIFQDEPTSGLGDGDQSPDGAGVGTDTAQVRSERSGLGDGRVYHIAFSAEDGRGGSCTGEVSVTVPHDQSGAAAVDQGALFDSTVP